MLSTTVTNSLVKNQPTLVENYDSQPLQSDSFKWMEIGQPNKTYKDITGHIKDTITTNDHGWAEFRCLGGSVSVWVPQ